MGGMPRPQTGATHYHVQLRLSDKGHAIEVLVVCYVLWLGSIFYGWVFGQAKSAWSGPLHITQIQSYSQYSALYYILYFKQRLKV